MFLVYVKEGWNRNFDGVVAPDEIGFLFFVLILDSYCGVVCFNGVLDGVWNALEGLRLIAPEHPLLHHFHVVHSLQISG